MYTSHPSRFPNAERNPFPLLTVYTSAAILLQTVDRNHARVIGTSSRHARPTGPTHSRAWRDARSRHLRPHQASHSRRLRRASRLAVSGLIPAGAERLGNREMGGVREESQGPLLHAHQGQRAQLAKEKRHWRKKFSAVNR